MSISSGYDKFKDYHQTEGGSYKLTSRWTSSNTVELDDGSTAEEKFAEIDNKFKNQDNSINNINTRLNGLVDNNGRFRQIVMVDAVTGTDYVLEIRNGELVYLALPPGLYDENCNLVASWDELVNDYGLVLSDNDYEGINESVLAEEKLSSGVKLIIPDGIKYIGIGAFNGCSSLTSITIPDSATIIYEDAFACCTGLTSITIPDSVTDINSYAFSYCTGLTSITIPDSVTSIGQNVFAGCTGLTSVVIGDGLTYINESMFKECTGLTSITIPDSVTRINYDAFSGCTGLTSITIPDSVTDIESYAFDECTGLTSVYFEHTTAPTFGRNCFRKSSGDTCTFYFKNSTVANAFIAGTHYNSSYGTKSTDYDW